MALGNLPEMFACTQTIGLCVLDSALQKDLALWKVSLAAWSEDPAYLCPRLSSFQTDFLFKSSVGPATIKSDDFQIFVMTLCQRHRIRVQSRLESCDATWPLAQTSWTRSWACGCIWTGRFWDKDYFLVRRKILMAILTLATWFRFVRGLVHLCRRAGFTWAEGPQEMTPESFFALFSPILHSIEPWWLETKIWLEVSWLHDNIPLCSG